MKYKRAGFLLLMTLAFAAPLCADETPEGRGGSAYSAVAAPSSPTEVAPEGYEGRAATAAKAGRTAPTQELIALVKNLQDEMTKMKGLIEEQQYKIELLEQRPQRIVTTQTESVKTETSTTAPMSDSEFNQRLSEALTGSNKWLKDLKFGGDMRLRYEAFDFSSGDTDQTDPRNRFRFRLRFGFEKKFNEEMKIAFGLCSGEAAGSGLDSGLQVDPTSTNQTFDNLFNFKNIWIEKVYATYTPLWAKWGALVKSEITAGKVKNPFEQGSSEIIWDRDVRPEGIYEKGNFKILDAEKVDVKLYALAGQFILDEDASVGGDAELWANQLGLSANFHAPFFEKPVEVLSAVSYYHFRNYAERNNWRIGTTSLARGNPVAADGTSLAAKGFKIVESYSEVAIYPYGLPTRFFLDVAHNAGDQANEPTTVTGTANSNAWALGAKLGELGKKGDLELRYEYRWIGANSVPGAFNDSDFGLGYSGKAGSVFKAGYNLTDNISLNGAMFFVDNLNGGTAGIRDEHQNRFQVDLNWKF